MADIDVSTLEDAEAVLACMAAMGREIAMCEMAAAELIATINKDLAEQTEHLHVHVCSLKQALGDFAEKRKAELFSGKKKSVALRSGSFGFRQAKTVELIPGQTWDAVLQALKSAKLTRYVRAKATESVDKGNLRDLTPDQMHRVGVCLPAEDVFFCKLNDETAQGAV